MKKQRYEYKQEAKDMLEGKYERPIIILLIFFVVESAISSVIAATAPKYSNTFPITMIDPGNPGLNSIMGIVSFLVGAAITYGTIKMGIYLYQKKDLVPEQIAISGFKENFLRNAFLQFMKGLFIFLWSLLLIIPGIVKAYAYSMSFYIVNKEPNTEALSSIDMSKKYMNGYKMDLFLLDLSYLGWYFIGLFTLGILWLWIVPKHLLARTMYFEEIYEVNNPVTQEEPEI